MKTTNGFLYKHVTRELRRRIDRGVYGRGDRIPSERALVKELRVSAITIRRAIRDLSFEGLLIRRQGLGVFVAQKPKIVRSPTVMS
jgi:GntR family transcriptional regulator